MAIQMSSELLDGCVLAILDKEDYYGYALTQRVQGTISVSESTLYPVLRRLKNNQFVTTYDQPFQGRNRRYYQITTQGRDKLDSIRQDWIMFQANVDTLLKER
ncbi:MULTISPECIES: PadR family transcriptional regulator [Leuconostoc]|uniref:PadR family transcriptional regulator n=1 Tax=Leuconostoc TaxID=1243 RepID=UPI00090C6A6D|nr:MULTISPECIES: PadR family transcriptional regulator [Leuconostoc]API72942.1 PadR family transcriptional regulator [Leuconostoc suionicum]MBE4726807.1 PadR family transcriptional regulator [Leuconostoc suionicum]MBS1008818.1 PadR family transcriptional regulator [Leuconostoc suionicum]MCT4383121.1 PadR family transcriptional regulator [Leuconostoc suionicum]MCT4402816.1 PadR family transcriptional regulator [Leuconostoc suionicum]